jgi:hypothetical protein
MATTVAWCAGLFAAACSSATTPTPEQPAVRSAAVVAVQTWLHHLDTGDDAAAFADLAPRSQAAVGDVDNYRRGSGRFAPTYARFARGRLGDPLVVSTTIVVVTMTIGEPSPGASAVPVRRVGTAWRVDPILDAGSFSFTPDDGAEVSSRPTLAVQLDDPATRALVWFDRRAAIANGASFRAASALSAGWHVATVALVRGDDVVTRALRLHVGDA